MKTAIKAGIQEWDDIIVVFLLLHIIHINYVSRAIEGGKGEQVGANNQSRTAQLCSNLCPFCMYVVISQ